MVHIRPRHVWRRAPSCGSWHHFRGIPRIRVISAFLFGKLDPIFNKFQKTPHGDPTGGLRRTPKDIEREPNVGQREAKGTKSNSQKNQWEIHNGDSAEETQTIYAITWKVGNIPWGFLCNGLPTKSFFSPKPNIFPRSTLSVWYHYFAQTYKQWHMPEITI